MPLDTQKFRMKKYWLKVGLEKIPYEPKIFQKKNLSMARKEFLAGKNMLTGIKNWLDCANLISNVKKKVELTDLGRLIREHDPEGDHPWTWWIFHINLCANEDALPYSTFFNYFDSDGRKWMTIDEVIKTLNEEITKNYGSQYKEKSIRTYFEGINATFKPGSPLYDLGLLQRRYIEVERKDGIRRSATKVADIVVVYAVLKYRQKFFRSFTTVETRLLLEKGAGKAIGLSNNDFREKLTRITQNKQLNHLIQYSSVANIDSIEIKKPDLRAVVKSAYLSGDVQWH